MDYLRWILLAVAVVVIIAIYLFSRTRKNDQYSSPLDAANDVPSFSADKNPKQDWVDGVGPVRVVNSPDAISDKESIEPIKYDPEPEPVKAEAVSEPGLNESGLSEPDLSEPDLSEPGNLIEHGTLNEAEPLDVTPMYTAGESIDPVVEKTAGRKIETTPDAIPETSAESAAEMSREVTEEAVADQTPEAEKDSAEDNEVIDDVISVFVLASPEEPLIKGEKILSASYAIHMEHGDMKIFHRHAQTTEREIQFSMANMLEPGWFDIDNMHNMETRGVSFFMQVNLVENPSQVLDEMLISAHTMSTMLGVQLCNAHRKPLDEAYTNSLRDKVKRLAERKAQMV